MSYSEGNLTLSVRGLGKKYRIPKSRGDSPTTLAESLVTLLKPGAPKRYTEFWANRDISFDLHEGEIVGIVGRNGAGKSTLLKLLSRITEPTEGEIKLYGRVGSLLEVGTGFHPELTGRENIFLNGAILGMKRPEIMRQFAATVEFAEIEPFLDTPVKRYSSGMYVRLAFAVAAHLDPEILIVDEVLAVGDTRFQKKCLGKMHDVARTGGRTVLFVSHNMGAVRSLCNRAILLKDGFLALDDTTEAVSGFYLRDSEDRAAERTFESEPGATRDFEFRAVRVLDKDELVARTIDLRDPLTVEIDFMLFVLLANFRIKIIVLTSEGILLFTTFDSEWGSRQRLLQGVYSIRCGIPPHILNEGTYTLNIVADIPNDRVSQEEDGVVSFRVDDVTGHGSGADKLPGLIRPEVEWGEVTLR